MQTDPGLGDADDQLYEHPSVEWVSGLPHPPSWPRAGKVAQALTALNTLQTQQEGSRTAPLPKLPQRLREQPRESGPPLSSLPKLPQLPLLRRLSQCCRSIPEFRGSLLSITARLLSGPGRDFSVTHDTRSYLVLSFLRRVSPGDTPYLCYKHESPSCLPN